MIANAGKTAEKRYTITLSGRVLSTDPESPSAGQIVKVGTNPRVDSIEITAAVAGDIPQTREGAGSFRFVMPSDDITISEV